MSLVQSRASTSDGSHVPLVSRLERAHPRRGSHIRAVMRSSMRMWSSTEHRTLKLGRYAASTLHD